MTNLGQNSLALRADSLVTGYGKKQVVNGVTLQAAVGEIVAVIGHNGAGKSTLLKAIFGVLPIWSGHVCLNGRTWAKPTPRNLLRAGVAYVTQGSRVFPDLTVVENLELGGVSLRSRQEAKAGLERAIALFPALQPRLNQCAATLSGGEKQMLALANALILSPKVMLLDEPSLGLAPPLVSAALERIRQISTSSGVTVLIVEQKVREVLKISNRVYVLRNGQVSFSGSSTELQDDSRLRAVYL